MTTSRLEQAALFTEGRRRCAACSEIKSTAEFTRDARNQYGLNSLCTPCLAAQRRRNVATSPSAILRRRCRAHHITVEQFGAMLTDQGGRCAICVRPTLDMYIDHDHACCPGPRSCGACVRALLCRDCNLGLGSFSDSPAALRAAADYLESHA